ncbi:YtxH domain-containing protein [Flavobacterium xinjiangense]|uniref:Gas vesicle protein n=1 Tax=Flavobacterium xinjiangense TaxID=178356 RepID=A0A1M7PV20_9FLAO|nr:YtxH domain-containing protein [Flavobacterium xinjiangense]SHN21413.1 Gas vesicle protein [Flavobacterium xinjiangense]
MKNSNLVLGLLGGIAAGTVLGILFAPAKGSENRKIIADKGSELNDNLKESVCKLSDKITQTITELKNDSKNILGNANDTLAAERADLENLKDINKAVILG